MKKAPLRVFKYAPIALLLIGSVFLFSRTNLRAIDRSYIFSDIVTYEYPMQRYFHDRLMKGELPLWNPYASAGNPVIGTLQARLIYPPHIILTTLFGLERGQLIEIFFHFFLALIGSYAMLRSFNFRYLPAFCGSLLFVLSAEFLGTFKLMNLLACLTWLPVCIFSIRAFAKHPTFLSGTGLACALAMLLYGGYPQYAFFAVHACALVFVFSIAENGRALLQQKLRLVLLLAMAVVLFGILTAPQLISAGEFFKLGLRGEVGVTLDQFNRMGGRPASSIFPDLLGGNSFTRKIVPILVVAGLGTGLLLRRQRALSITMLCLGIPFALLSMGSQGPIAEWYFNHYPLGSAFRIPERSIHILLIPCSVGLAFFIQNTSRVMRQLKSVPIPRSITPAVLSIVMLFLILPQKHLVANAFVHVARYIDGYGRSVQQSIPDQPQYRFDTTCNAFFAPCDKSGMLATRRNLSDYEPSNTYRSYLFSSLLSEDLRTRTKGTIWLGETHLDYKSLAQPNTYRLLGAGSVKWILGNRGLWLRAETSIQSQVTSYLTVRPEVVATPEILDFVSKTLGPAALMTMGDHLDQYMIFEMKGRVLPRAYLTNRIVLATDARAAAASLSGVVDPTIETVIEVPPGQSQLSRIDPVDHLTPVTFLLDKPEEVALETRSVGDAFLVLNDKFFPDWQCTIDGQQAEIFPANLMSRAVKIPPGKHRVEFQYTPRSFIVAACMSVIASLLIACLVAFTMVRTWRGQKQKRVA